MKAKFTITVLIFFGINVFAQIPNSGFENWTNFGPYMDANGWNSANSASTSTFYPVTRVSDPFPTNVGLYSYRIQNKPSVLPNWEAYGFSWNSSITSGPKAAFPISGHPNSLTGYYKWFPQSGDTMYINVLLYKTGSVVSSGKMTKITATTNWTSFNLPVSAYVSADSANIILAAFNADGPNNIPYGNSVLHVDNLNFDNLVTGIEDLNAQAEVSVLPNPFFETISVNTSDQGKFEMIDLLGATVLQGKLEKGPNTIAAPHLNPGLYFLQMEIGNKTLVRKMVKN
jgi:hypothetical protein